MVTRSGTIIIRCEIQVEVIGLNIAATGHEEVTDKTIIDALCAGEFDGWDVGDPRDGGILAVVHHLLTEDMVVEPGKGVNEEWPEDRALAGCCGPTGPSPCGKADCVLCTPLGGG